MAQPTGAGDGTTLPIDLRSDVLAAPTAAVWQAMQSARIGWSGVDRDPNVAALERRLATLTGLEDALFVATGSLANLLALRGLAPRGSRVVLERRSHLCWNEGASLADTAGVLPLAVDGGPHGRIDAAGLSATLDEARALGQRPALVCLENSHNLAGGTTLAPAGVAELAAVARAGGARLFVDGARLWNVAARHEAPLAALLDGVDAAMISLNKGLGAPLGAVLVGDAALVARARADLGSLGVSGLHRLGAFAAGALAALDEHSAVFADDNRRARALAEGLAALAGLDVALSCVETNIVRVRVTAAGVDGHAYVAALRREGIGTRVVEGDDTVRFVTHREIDDAAVGAVVAASRAFLDRAAA